MNNETIQNKCIKRYLDNINYFEANHPEVFKKLGLFEIALDSGQYEEKYSLEFINNSFDIKYIKDNTLIYKTNLNEHSKNRSKNIKLDDSNSFKLFNPIDVPLNYKIPKDITDTYLETLYPLVDFVKKNINDNFKIERIEKFIFFGTLLANHLETICNKFNPRVIMVIEPNIEIFKLSLFTTDYSKLNVKSNIIFAIGNDEDELNKNIEIFLKQYDYYNYLIKFDVIDSQYTYLFNSLANILANRNPTFFPFSTRLMSIERHIYLLKNNYKFINFRNKLDILTKKQILMVAPGPSLSNNIKWLQDNKDNFIIVALGASLKTLYKYNIKPDIITTIDPNPIILNQFENIEDDFYNDTILFSSTNSPIELLNKFNKNKIFIYQAIYDLIQNELFYGKSIGESTYRILLLLGAQKLYLLGTDLSIDKITGSAHTKEHIHYKERENINTHNIIQDKTINMYNLIEVDGNIENKVFTTRIFYDILELYKKFENSIPSSTRKIYNLSNGAKIHNTIPCKTNTVKVNTDNKLYFMNNLLNDLISNSNTIDINEHINNTISYSLKTAKEILYLLNLFKTKKFKTYDDMMYNKLTITIEIIKLSKKDINKVSIDLIASYNDNVEQYINVFFNTKLNTQKKDKFNTLFKYWLKPQILIFKKYINILEKLIDKKD